VWINPEETLAFVTCRGEIGASLPGRIIVVDLVSGKIVKSLRASIYPWHLLPDPSGRVLYVNNFQSSSVSVVDVERQEIVDSFVVQNGPAMMCFAPGTDLLFVSCFYTDNVVAVNTRTHEVEKVIHVDTNPTSLEFIDGAKLRVLCGGESSLLVVDLRTDQIIERSGLLFGAYAFHRVDRK
jgi:DNA-binding beta-propeller fold protein YncE